MLQAIARLYKQGLGPQTAASSEGTRSVSSLHLKPDLKIPF